MWKIEKEKNYSLKNFILKDFTKYYRLFKIKRDGK